MLIKLSIFLQHCSISHKTYLSMGICWLEVMPGIFQLLTHHYLLNNDEKMDKKTSLAQHKK